MLGFSLPGPEFVIFDDNHQFCLLLGENLAWPGLAVHYLFLLWFSLCYCFAQFSTVPFLVCSLDARSCWGSALGTSHHSCLCFSSSIPCSVSVRSSRSQRPDVLLHRQDEDDIHLSSQALFHISSHETRKGCYTDTFIRCLRESGARMKYTVDVELLFSCEGLATFHPVLGFEFY